MPTLRARTSRRPRRPAYALLALAVCALVLAAGPATAAAAPDAITVFEAPDELLNSATRESALDEIQSFGVEGIRVVMYWQRVAPASESSTKPAFDASDPDAYAAGRWVPYDRLLDSAGARGLKVLLTVSGPVPRWATKKRRDNLTNPRPDEFEAFMTAVGRRYGDKVALVSIYNEPNHARFLQPQYKRGRPASPALYRKLFLAANDGLEASGHGDLPLLFGETAPVGNSQWVAPLAFLRGTLCLSRSFRKKRSCGILPADGYAHHPYTTPAGPYFVPRKPDDATLGVLSRLTRTLDRAARAGAVTPGMGLYLTEFGVQTEPDPFLGVSFQQQGETLGIAQRMAYQNPRVRLFSQYLLRDDPTVPGPRSGRYGGFESGLRRHSGKKKLGYEAFRLPLAAEARGRRVRLWGMVRPAHDLGPQQVTILQANRRSGPFRTLRTLTTDSKAVWRLNATNRRGRVWRVRWTSAEGRTFTGPPVRANSRR